MVTFYAQHEKPKALAVAEAFARGCNGSTSSVDMKQLVAGDAAFYGVRPRWAHLWEQAKREGRTWYYVDNSYFDAAREMQFRVGVNRTQAISEKRSDGSRLKRLGVEVKPWRRSGRKVLVTAQTDEFMECVAGWPQQSWLEHVAAHIPDRFKQDIAVEVRRKGDIPLQEALADTWIVITHSSACAVEALIEGIPCVVTDSRSPMHVMSTPFGQIESPLYPDGREEWLARLADSQWSLDEMRDGTAWRAINA